LAVMVTEAPGPGATVEGNAPTEIQPSAAVTELMVSVPPPAFTMLSAAAEGCGLVDNATKDNKGDPTLNSGGAAVTVSDTAMVWALPAQSVEVQVMVTVPKWGEPAALSGRAALFSPTVILPGVPAAPPTSSHGTEDDFVNASTCDTTLEETAIALGAGAAVVPDVMANEVEPADSTRSGAVGLMVPVTSIVAGVPAESVATIEKAKSPAAEGVPEIWPFEKVRPGGSEPLMLNVMGGTPPEAVRICAG
jgi:hypothetical protein